MDANMNAAEQEKIHAEIANLMAESAKLNAEANKLNRETFWYPVAIASGLMGAAAAITATIIKLL